MKIPPPEIEYDEFGDCIIQPIVSREEIDDKGRKTQYLENMAEYVAYTKQVSRNRDAAMLESGEIDQAGLRRKNDMFYGVDFSRFRIVAIGDRKYGDID